MNKVSGRPKKCRWCGSLFRPARTFQVWCSPDCAIQIAREIRSKEKKKELKKRKESIKTRSEWLNETQAAFNAWIRERDHGNPCISCGITTGQMQAGHYRSVGACPALRFNPLNCHAQCAQCNKYKSGNQIEYRRALVKKIGANLVEWLEQDHQPNKYSVEEIRDMKRYYVAMKKELIAVRATKI